MLITNFLNSIYCSSVNNMLVLANNGKIQPDNERFEQIINIHINMLNAIRRNLNLAELEEHKQYILQLQTLIHQNKERLFQKWKESRKKWLLYGK